MVYQAVVVRTTEYSDGLNLEAVIFQVGEHRIPAIVNTEEMSVAIGNVVDVEFEFDDWSPLEFCQCGAPRLEGESDAIVELCGKVIRAEGNTGWLDVNGVVFQVKPSKATDFKVGQWVSGRGQVWAQMPTDT